MLFIQAAAQLVTFMENFYTVFPEYSKMDVSVPLCTHAVSVACAQEKTT